MKRRLVVLALAWIPQAHAQTYLTIEQNPLSVRVVDVTAGAIVSEPVVDLTIAQPPIPIVPAMNVSAVGSRVWVAAGSYVYRFDRAGNQLGVTGPFAAPLTGMDEVIGSVWVANNLSLYHLTSTGAILFAYPAPNARDVFGFGGQLLVSNPEDRRIEVYDLNGQFVSVFASAPSPFAPGQIALRSNGNLLVESGVRIYELDPAGNFVAEYDAGSFENGVVPLDGDRLLVSQVLDGLQTFDIASGESVPVPGFSTEGVLDFASQGAGGNSYFRYCASNANTTGFGAEVGGYGSPSVSTDTFGLQATRVPPNRFGYFFYGPNLTHVPWGEGFLCTGPAGLNRILPGQAASAGGIAARDLSFAALPPPAAILPGSTWSFQFVFRDPTGGPAGFNSTDAVRLTFEP